MKMKINKANITLTQVPDLRVWVLKRWELRCGELFMGQIIKRWAGRGTPLLSRKRKAKHITYQTHVNLLSADTKGLPGGSAHKEDLKSAKKFIIRKWTKILNNLTREEKD
jgi:hypothetical protein